MHYYLSLFHLITLGVLFLFSSTAYLILELTGKSHKDRSFYNQYKAVDMANEGAKADNNTRHCVILTQDNKWVVVSIEGLKRINKIRKKNKLQPTQWQEILDKAKYITP